MHPLVDNLDSLKDKEIEDRIQSLSKKYFQTQNPDVRHQITVFLDIYKDEMSARRAKELQKQYQKRDIDLDGLIDVS